MGGSYQERIFLNLVDDTKETLLAKNILKSSLGLASDIIKDLFDENLDSLKDSLDDTNKLAAGTKRAGKLNSSYFLSSTYPLMFSFHQYIQGLYRAKQGRVLEKVLQGIIRNYAGCDKVPEKSAEMLSILRKSFGANLPNLDIDAMGADSANERVIIIQLCSRGNTGGTTAKESPVDLLRALLKTDGTPDSDILYLVCIWDARGSQQKNSTIEKMYSSLEDLIEISIEDFFNKICAGVSLKEKITLKMAYGTDEIADSISEWTGSGDNEILEAISKVISLIENWDDLWISYALANSEIEIMSSSEYSNVRLLNEKYNRIDIKFNFNSYEELVRSIDEVSIKMVCMWGENSLHPGSPSDQAHYVRDLLFLKACYEKLS